MQAIALQAQAADEITFVATGNVPYDKTSKTLADLIIEELASEPHPKEIAEGVGIFSEARFVTESAAKQGNVELIIVSSDWYFWPGKLIWEEFAAENKVPIHFVMVRDTGGLQTKLFYAAYGLIAHLAYLATIDFGLFRIRCDRLLEYCLNALQSGRKDGFTTDLCK